MNDLDKVGQPGGHYVLLVIIGLTEKDLKKYEQSGDVMFTSDRKAVRRPLKGG